RRRYRWRALGEPLPLRHVPEDPRSGSSRREVDVFFGRQGVSATPRLTRRRFLETSSGLVIGFLVAPQGRLLAQAAAPASRPLPPPNAFLRIGEDDTVTVLLAHSEMGQGIWTTLPMMIAEELECDWSKIRVETAPAAPVYAHVRFGMQMTGGSTTTSSE